jgi:hypothetical protein
LIGVARRAGTVVVAGRTGARCAFRFGVEVALCLCRAGGDRRFARARVCDVRGVTAAGVKELRRTPALVPVAPREPPSLPAPVAVFPPPETPAAAGVSQDSCRIEWWRGWVRSQFVACSSNGSGHKTLIAESPSFSWRSNEPPPESPTALAAYLELARTLDGHGWEPDSRGDVWFAARFRRAGSGAHEAAPSATIPSA